MKILQALCLALLVLAPLPATAAPAHSEKIEKSRCYVYAPYDPSLFLRTSAGAYDVISYDLAFLQRRQILLIAYNNFGTQVLAQEYQEETPGSRHFETNERSGNEATLSKEIARFLKEQDLFRCPA